MPQVEITGCSPGFKTSSCIDVLRSFAGLTPAEARAVTEKILRSERSHVGIRSDADAKLLVAALVKLGASAHVVAAAD